MNGNGGTGAALETRGKAEGTERGRWKGGKGSLLEIRSWQGRTVLTGHGGKGWERQRGRFLKLAATILSGIGQPMPRADSGSPRAIYEAARSGSRVKLS